MSDARIRKTVDEWRVSNPQVASNIAWISARSVKIPMLNVRMVKRGAKGAIGRGRASLGKVEEYFLEMLAPGDTFLFSGKVLRFEDYSRERMSRQPGFALDPKVPAYAGGKFPLSTYLADQVRSMLDDHSAGVLPEQSATGWRCNATSPHCRSASELLIETFPRGGATTWSPIPSRGGWRGRRSACF